jgi:diguanylate cyclase (GGDEF)-like protein/PAS domain S-box-containing protein
MLKEGDPVSDHAELAALIGPGSILEATPECLVVAGGDGRILFANQAAQELTGFASAELVGQPVELLISVELQGRDRGERIETICRRRGGDEVPVEIHVGRVHRPHDLVIVALRDVSQLHADREARYVAEAKYRTLIEQIPAVVYVDPVDEDSDTIYVSPQVEHLIGITPDEYLANPAAWYQHVHPEDSDRAWDEYTEACRNHVPLVHEYRMIHSDGTVRWVLEHALPISDGDGNPWLIQGVIFDITERKRSEEQVAFLAYHDKLTGLPNRVLFEEMLDNAVARAKRSDLGVGVLYLDLDNFKLVNDSLGHPAGDDLLVELADRLRSRMRESDLVARQGGDEFLVLLADLERVGATADDDPAGEAAEMVTQRLHDALREPFDLGGVRFYATGSVGVSLFPRDATDSESLLKNADAAMYQSKRTQPGGSMFFATRPHDSMHELSFTTRLRKAVEDKHWVLHWQPVIDLLDGSVAGVEALIRWQGGDGGLVAPGEFIPVAEELGLIEAIGDWVIDELGRQQRVWQEDHGLDLKVGFNLSPRQLWSANLSEKIIGKLTLAGVDPHRVVVEITESMAMSDPDRTQRILQELNAWGLSLAIDDFGTGYSSLARLKHLPVDILKIDQSFVRDVHRDPSLASMVRAMIQLAQGLDMFPLAEGIETYEEYEFLRANGCRMAQGFLFSRPVPGDEIPALVTRAGGLLPQLAER